MNWKSETLFIEGVGASSYECLREIGALMKWARIRPSGGDLTAEPSVIVAPDGGLFIAFSFNGDLDAWRSGVELYARARGGVIARIDLGELTTDCGFTYALESCEVLRAA